MDIFDRLHNIVDPLPYYKGEKTAEESNEIDRKREEIANLIPAVRKMFGYQQRNAAHQYDLWLHSVNTVIYLPKNLDDNMLYLAALLHDIGKPDCQCRGAKPEDTNMHYYGHPERSMEIVRDVVLPELDRKGIQIEAEDRRIYNVIILGFYCSLF